jgi:uncharacterized protein
MDEPDALHPGPAATYDCVTCGACCDYDPTWPRFTLDTDAALDLIPAKLVARHLGGMRCTGNRCDALTGVVGQRVACSIYDIRPQICHACEPGDDACEMARARHGVGR